MSASNPILEALQRCRNRPTDLQLRRRHQQMLPVPRNAEFP